MASAEGRLAVHELEHRVAAALRARTYSELDATITGLPGKRLSEGRSAPRRVVRAVRAHPALLLVVIPVALAAVATLVAIAVLWYTIVLVAFLLGHRRRWRRRPWTYAPGRRFGPAHGG